MNSSDESGHYASPPCSMHELDTADSGTAAVDAQQRTDVARWRKAERARQLERRKALGRTERERLAERITGHLEGVLGDVKGLTVAVYWPIRGEPDLRALIERLTQRGARCALPVVVEPAAPLVFRAWAPGDGLERGVWNIPVPAEGAELTPDIVISPVVAFDCACYRLGNGGGFYDRTLAAMPEKPRMLGVGYAQAAVPTIYPQPHDIPMEAVVTENGVMRPRRGRAVTETAECAVAPDPAAPGDMPASPAAESNDSAASSAHETAAQNVGVFRYAHADGYSEAIPIDELVSIAKSVVEECGSSPETEVRGCAQRMVRSRLCPCAASVDALVEAVVAEFRRQITQASRS